MDLLMPMIMNLLINLIYTLLALLLAVYALRILDRKVFTRIDFEAEIAKGNIAAAILMGMLLAFVAIVVSSGLRG